MAPACPRCDAAGQDGNFCTGCGYDLRPPGPPVVTPRHRVPATPAPSVVSCPACGARNAESRRACGRCHAPLSGEATAAPVPPPVPDGAFGPPLRAASAARSSRLLLGVLAAAGMVLLTVTATLLIARGIGPFAEEQPAGTELTPVTVAEVRASSSLAAEPPARLTDGDPGTSWAEGASGPGIGESVELRLAEPVRLQRVTIWNGDQRGERFLVRNRVHELRIDVGDERFTVELLDTQGPQLIELPRPVRARGMRLTILSVHGATPDADTALSGVEVYGTPVG